MRRPRSALRLRRQARRGIEPLRALAARLAAAREEERARVAREIHDQLGQNLTALKMDVAWLQRHLDDGRASLLPRTQAMAALIDATIQAVRRIATELRPAVLDNQGLAPALEWQLQEIERRSGLECRLDAMVEDMPLDAEGCTTLFRIAQEALTNVVRHAEATRVEVSLSEDAGHVVLCVRDNGRGITAREMQDQRALGLLGMRERALARGGRVEIYAVPGQGTTVIARLPLGQE